MSAASVGLLALTPVLAVVAAAVAIKLGRPVLFRQDRPGKDGRVFRLYKFRTMKTLDPERDLVTDEQRLTPFGRALRSTSLDELPTLVNVIKGDMSVVGPRPLLVQYLDRYSAQEARRHEVRPGITGLAQASGRNSLSWADKFVLDVGYVDRRSIVLDAKILWLTVVAVIRRSDVNAGGLATMAEFNGQSVAPFVAAEADKRLDEYDQYKRQQISTMENTMDQSEFMKFVEMTLEVDSGTIKFADNLDDIDWDSLANIGFIAEVDTRFSVSVDADRLAESSTVSDLFQLLNDSIKAS